MSHKTWWRSWCECSLRNWWQIQFVLVLTIVALLIFVLTGCTQSQTREQTATDKVDKIAVSGSLTLPTADGPRVVPVQFTIDRRGTEDQRRESDTKAGLDPDAVGRAVGSVIGPMLQGATGGMPWASIMSAAGTGIVAATTGYLALKKREQIRMPKGGRS